jgi:uncharacterized protein YyaL (SSP411 family)
MNQAPDTAYEPPITPPTPQRGKFGTWFLFVIALVVLGAVFYYQSRPIDASFTWEHDLDAALTRASAENRNVLIDFHTAGCGGCRWMDSNVFARDDVGEALSEWIPVKIDGEKNPRTAAQYDIYAYPTIVVLAPDGELLAQHVGTLEPKRMLGLIEAISKN